MNGKKNYSKISNQKYSLLRVSTSVPRGLGKSGHAMRIAGWEKVPFTLGPTIPLPHAFFIIFHFHPLLPPEFFFLD
ncbi:hypothetical protein BDV33DRAFT_169401 [Aspergillus novoparasiticus]|uniref:Uncharacterized protein n=1 Tax=Aspergillus novoparasiticus TaxID=986946 RepID=A0A5N6EWZ7_9EURO|nr:hypothetical protein BDV33DRAFT_169401 [Aspergillus novoparasiticus]